MADEADLANHYMTNAIEQALGKRKQPAAKPVKGRFCQHCGDVVPEARRKLGFGLCIQCAEESERRNALFAS